MLGKTAKSFVEANLPRGVYSDYPILCELMFPRGRVSMFSDDTCKEAKRCGAPSHLLYHKLIVARASTTGEMSPPPAHESKAGPSPSARRPHSGSTGSDSTSETSSVGSNSTPGDAPSCFNAHDRPYLITITPKFLVATLLAVTCLAFSVGMMSRIMLVSSMGVHPAHPMYGNSIAMRATSFQDKIGLTTPVILVGKEVPPTMSKRDDIGVQAPSILAGKDMSRLPTPAIIAGKKVPPTTYTSKIFQQGGALTSRTVHLDRCPANFFHGTEDDADEVTPHEDEGLHLPSGQHLLIDIQYVDHDFLNSEEKLATAMIDLVNDSKLTLLSYHCHSLVPVGVSCVGVLLESHVSSCRKLVPHSHS